MHTKRVIPCLDVKDGRVVKGVQFLELRDAGDPVEAAEAYDAKGADETGYCNGALYTRNGLPVLIVSHNKECFGAAGCITNTIAFMPDPDQLSALGDAIRTGMTIATAPPNQVRGGPDAVIYNLSE